MAINSIRRPMVIKRVCLTPAHVPPPPHPPAQDVAICWGEVATHRRHASSRFTGATAEMTNTLPVTVPQFSATCVSLNCLGPQHSSWAQSTLSTVYCGCCERVRVMLFQPGAFLLQYAHTLLTNTVALFGVCATVIFLCERARWEFHSE